MRNDIENKLRQWQESAPPEISRNMKSTLQKLPPKKRKTRKLLAISALVACLLLVFFFSPLGQQAMAALSNGFAKFIGRYADHDQRMELLAEHADTPGGTEGVSLPVQIDGVYYDGNTLRFAYLIGNASPPAEEFIPSQEELAQMRAVSADLILPREGESHTEGAAQSGDAFMNGILEDRKNGKPCGYRAKRTYMDDDIYTTDGVALNKASGDRDPEGEDLRGTSAYDIPSELQNEDSFTVEAGFSCRETLYYFDGTQDYFLQRIAVQEKIPVDVRKIGEERTYAGSMSFDEYAAQVELHVGPALITGTITLTPEGDEAAREAWLALYDSEGTVNQLPMYYFIFDGEGNLLTEQDISNGSYRDEDHLFLEVEIAAISNLPDVLELRPMQSDAAPYKYSEDHIILRTE